MLFNWNGHKLGARVHAHVASNMRRVVNSMLNGFIGVNSNHRGTNKLKSMFPWISGASAKFRLN